MLNAQAHGATASRNTWTEICHLKKGAISHSVQALLGSTRFDSEAQEGVATAGQTEIRAALSRASLV